MNEYRIAELEQKLGGQFLTDFEILSIIATSMIVGGILLIVASYFFYATLTWMSNKQDNC